MAKGPERGGVFRAHSASPPTAERGDPRGRGSLQGLQGPLLPTSTPTPGFLPAHSQTVHTTQNTEQVSRGIFCSASYLRKVKKCEKCHSSRYIFKENTSLKTLFVLPVMGLLL